MARVNKEKEIMRTDELIHQLSAQAGQTAIKNHAVMPFDRALGLSLMLSLVGALLVVIGLSGVRPDLFAMLTTWVFQFKVVAMALLVWGGIILVRACGIPGVAVRPVRALLPGVLFLLAGVIFDRSGFPLLGERQFSAPLCVGVIVAAALPGLIFILAGLRRGIPTRLSSAGAISGILSGSLAAMVYTIACVNDGPLFVAIWYVAAISISAGVGAVAGRYALAW
ncbi:NrsF family protein [Pseudomonas sp. X10]